jgi:hypothetical protein
MAAFPHRPSGGLRQDDVAEAAFGSASGSKGLSILDRILRVGYQELPALSGLMAPERQAVSYWPD